SSVRTMLILTKAVTMSRPTGASEMTPKRATVWSVREAFGRSNGDSKAVGANSAGWLTWTVVDCASGRADPVSEPAETTRVLFSPTAHPAPMLANARATASPTTVHAGRDTLPPALSDNLIILLPRDADPGKARECRRARSGARVDPEGLPRQAELSG